MRVCLVCWSPYTAKCILRAGVLCWVTNITISSSCCSQHVLICFLLWISALCSSCGLGRNKSLVAGDSPNSVPVWEIQITISSLLQRNVFLTCALENVMFPGMVVANYYFRLCQVNLRISWGEKRQLIPQWLCYLSIKCDLFVTWNTHNYLLWILLKDTGNIKLREMMLSCCWLQQSSEIQTILNKNQLFVHLYLNFSTERKRSKNVSCIAFKFVFYFL